MPPVYKKIYQLYDRKARDFCSSLMLVRTDEAAVRSFCHMMTDERSPFSKYPVDYDLYCLGEQLEEEGPQNGVLVPSIPPVIVMSGETAIDMMNRQAEKERVAERARLALIDAQNRPTLGQIQGGMS